jgi:protoheme IX farnesyltransferase
MSKIKVQHIDHSIEDKTYSVLSDYLMLVKPGLTSMVVFTAIASFLVASELAFSWTQLLVLGVGGFCVAGASNTLNQVLEKDYDSLMKRTMNRPVTMGRISTSHGTLFGGLLCLVGVTTLSTFNVWAGFLGMFAFVAYAFVYTPLKRHSRAAVLVGAIAGAMPMAIGVVAFTGTLTWLAVILFAIQFAWQYPHFWAIGFLGHEDYNKAGFKFVPMKGDKPCKSVAYSSIAYCVVLIAIAGLLVYINYLSMIAGIAMAILGGVYLWYALVFEKEFDLNSAKNLMFSSLLYIPVVMMILIIDKM